VSTVSSILHKKGNRVVTIDPGATVLEAARLMNEHGIGGLVVVDGTRIAGIFTERDVMRRVVVRQMDPSRTTVGEVMTTEVATCVPDTGIEAVRALMTGRRIRHLPVTSGGTLSGIITIGDVLAYDLREQQATIELLNGYVYGTR